MSQKLNHQRMRGERTVVSESTTNGYLLYSRSASQNILYSLYYSTVSSICPFFYLVAFLPVVKCRKSLRNRAVCDTQRRLHITSPADYTLSLLCLICAGLAAVIFIQSFYKPVSDLVCQTDGTKSLEKTTFYLSPAVWLKLSKTNLNVWFVSFRRLGRTDGAVLLLLICMSGETPERYNR